MNFEVNEINVRTKPVKCLKILGTPIQTRNPTHTVVLLDTSGSMDEGSKLKNVKKSLNFLLKFLQKNDTISLITFNYGSQILIENMNCSNEYMQAFEYTIDTLKADGGTNLSAGLLNVKSVLERTQTNNLSKTGLIILTDGHANEGLSRSEDLLRIIEGIKTVSPSISISTIGYNDDHNASLLKDIATYGSGSYNIVNNIEQVASVFGDVLGGLITTVAQNVIVSIPSSWNCLNMYKTKINNNIKQVEVGDICGESETILLFENSDATAIQVSGVNTQTLESISNTITFNTDAYSSYKDPYMIAYIRNYLAYVLSHMDSIDKDVTKENLNEMKTYLSQPLISFNVIVKMLNDEIDSIVSQLNGSSFDTTSNLQTSMMLGFSRGLSRPRGVRPMRRRASISNMDEVTNLMNQVNVTMTPFGNRIQREITQQMASMTSSEDPNY